jgi:hypothetical protein
MIRIQVASVPDRDNLVAELWFENVQLAEISREQGQFEVEVYASGVSIPLDQYLDALARAKEELMK